MSNEGHAKLSSAGERECWKCGHRVKIGSICPICASVNRAPLDSDHPRNRKQIIQNTDSNEDNSNSSGSSSDESLQAARRDPMAIATEPRHTTTRFPSSGTSPFLKASINKRAEASTPADGVSSQDGYPSTFATQTTIAINSSQSHGKRWDRSGEAWVGKSDDSEDLTSSSGESSGRS